MKVKVLAVAFALMSGAAMAQPVYINVGSDFGSNGFNKVAGPNSTGWVEDLQYNYTSSSSFTDANNNGVFDAGDTVLSSGGTKLPSFDPAVDFGDNSITSLLPKQIGGQSHNGYFNDWFMTFGFDNLTGFMDYNPIDGFGLRYTGGTISFYAALMNVPAAQTQLVRIFDLIVTGSEYSASGLFLDGYVGNYGATAFNGVATTDMFNTSFNGANKTFGDITSTLGADGNPIKMKFRVDLNSNSVRPNIVYQNAGDTVVQGATHDGSISFNAQVSEPASVAMLGLGLLGLGFMRKRKF